MSYHMMAPAPHAIVVERKGGPAVRAQRKTFSRTTVVALSLIGMAALCHKLSIQASTQYLADGPSPSATDVATSGIKAVEGDISNEGKELQSGITENWVSPPACIPPSPLSLSRRSDGFWREDGRQGHPWAESDRRRPIVRRAGRLLCASAPA